MEKSDKKSKHTILVTGSGGMLGHDMTKILEGLGHRVLSYDRTMVDITDVGSVMTLLREEFDILINCAAYTNVDKAENDREACYAVNVQGVINLVDLCVRKDAVLVQISTDYVFDGSQQVYFEDSVKNPINYYGQTKAEAEDIIEKTFSKYYIARTSWLFGHGGKNFVDTILRLVRERGEVTVVNDQRGCPTSTVDLSNMIAELFSLPYGIYHLTNEGSCTWYEYANEIIQLSGLQATVKPCTSDQFPQIAQRPRCSVLQNGKVRSMRPWQEALRAYLEF